MNVLDLFSGIGGFSLGLERAGMRTVAFCEVNEFCRKVLKKRWPHVPILSDITTIGVEPMSCAGVSHAKTLATQATAPVLPPAVPVSGHGYAEPFAWYDQSTRLWRTWQRCFLTGWTPYAETWPRSGMTRSGIAYRLPPLVPLTRGIESGLLPTPCAQEGGFNKSLGQNSKIRPTLTMMARKNLWPTPRANDAEKRGDFDETNPRNGLPAAVKKWPTPQARDWKDGTNPKPHGRHSPSLGVAVAEQNISGALNPTWVEWLMGFPIGHTDLELSETPSFPKSRKSSDAQSCKPKEPNP